MGDDQKLPDNIIPPLILKIKRDARKKNNCKEHHYIVDSVNKEVYCEDCEAIIQPWDAIYDLARRHDEFHRELLRLHEQRTQLLNWKPHLVVLRHLEKIYRSRDMIPVCPHCGIGIDIHEWKRQSVNREYDQHMRRFREREEEKSP
jgi:hypothetical protein